MILDIAHLMFRKDRHCVYNVKLWCICIAIVAMEVKEYTRIPIVLDLHLTVNSINVLRSSRKGPDVFV
jgi:hypothetical protein